MATEVELFEYQDIANRPSIRGYVDANGVAQLALGAYTAARLITINGIQYLVDAGGNPAARLDNTPGADKSIIPTQSMESVAAMSTTVTVRMAPTGTYRTARVSWVNNGASGSAKLNIAANCENDVAGIVATQSALQRDAQMTMGDALLLISPVPITSLNFSSDGSITSDTHRLVVTFGA